MRSEREGANDEGMKQETKKVTVFVGSAHKGGATCRAARRFLENLESFGGVSGEIVFLSDYKLGVCRGCKTCFDRGEECCPLTDDRDALIEKMAASDGVVFASPNYSWQMSAIMKIFLERLGFLFHRPRFHGRTFTCIVVQGILRGGRIVKDLEFVGGGLGFNLVKGSCSRTLEPMDDMAFRMGRTNMKLLRDKDSRDYAYYRGQGWFESDFWYPTRLGPFKKAAGAFFDWAAAGVFRLQAGNGPAVIELEGVKS
jgi:multimeric flavodoxin WrbA